MKRSPLRAKRATPRRNEGRVCHERMKPKAAADPTGEQRRYWLWLRERGQCEACRTSVDLVIHHLLSPARGKVGRRDHWFVVLLCPMCHNMGTQSVHLLGSEAQFYRRHGVNLISTSVARLEEYRANPS